jgi:hypothetical protein
MQKMKKIIIVSFLLSMFMGVYSQNADNLSYKVESQYGLILKHTKHLKNLVKGPVNGVDAGFEWQTTGEKPWQEFLNFPIVGIGGSFVDLSNPDTLGKVIALYPYIKIPVIRNSFLNIYVKAGTGVSYLTKTFKSTAVYREDGSVDLDHSNAAIGSRINVYFVGSLNAEIPVTNGFFVTGSAGWNHASNGSFIQPNSGINILSAFVGIKYFPAYTGYLGPGHKLLKNIPREFNMELTLSGGARQLYYRDNQFFPTGSVSLGVYRPLTNYYRMGLATDLFYDGVFGEVNASTVASENETKYKRTYITSDLLSNKIRMGISWQHEMLIGRLIAGFHLGLYLYNPIKNLEPYDDAAADTLHKPLIYAYNIEQEDGWFYTRASMKYMLTRHVYASLGLKTHLQKAEFIEWGMGYRF